MSSKILLMGDFNYSSIDFVNHIVKPGDDSVETKLIFETEISLLGTRPWRGGPPRPRHLVRVYKDTTLQSGSQAAV